MSQPGGKRPAEDAANSHPQPIKKTKAEPATARDGGAGDTGEVNDQGGPRAPGAGSEGSNGDGQAAGLGSAIWRGGVRFFCDWVGGVRNGLGLSLLAGRRYYAGEMTAGRHCGLGVMWDSADMLLHCGRWKDHKFIHSQPVPLSRIAADSDARQYLSAADRARTLLLPDGGFYVGDFDAQQQQHGKGVAYHSNGKPAAAGSWRDGQLHGLGATWGEGGKRTQCGRFAQGELKEECAVPCSQLPADLSGANYGGAALLLPNGRHYVGPLNAQSQQHGDGGVEYRPDGSEYYRGQWRDSKPHGRGKFASLGRGSYEGEFVDGDFHGQGTYRWADGRVYDGHWARGGKSGLGTWTWEDGAVYEGEWMADQRSGFGVEWDKDGKVDACGRWANDDLVESRPVPLSKIPVGKFLSEAVRSLSAADRARTLLRPSGGHYVGDFNAEFRQHGEGEAYHADGSEHAGGQWRDGKLHGRGKATYLNGIYEGEFAAGQMSGQGTCRWANGQVYEGQWAQGQRSGLGSYTFPDGDVYEGEYAADERNGLGIEWNKDGKVLECGRWVDGKPVELWSVPLNKIPTGKHLSAADRARTLLLPRGGYYYVGDLDAEFRAQGQGVVYRADGSDYYSGQWRNGKLHGRGKAANSDGSSYEGEFVDFLPSGLGCYTFADGQVYEGEYDAEKRSGLGIEWNKDGKVVECGRWAKDELVETRAVPLSKILIGTRLSGSVRSLSAADSQRTLLFPGGGFYVGQFNARHQRHGQGRMHAADGALQDPSGSGVWREDRQLRAAEAAALELVLSPLSPAGDGGAGYS